MSENDVPSESPFAPVPPAPPPPLSSPGMWGTSIHPAGDVSAATSVRLSSADGSTSPRGKAKELHTLGGEFLRIIKSERLELGGNCILVSRKKILTSILQDGPMCGLVALAMCSEMVKKSIMSSDKLFDYARERGITLQGEMFSASAMADVAKEVIKCKSRVLEIDSQKSVQSLISHLVNGNPVCFPYDADANHQPCMKKGHKAHWAAVSGILIVRDASISEELFSVLQADSGLSGLYHIISAADLGSQNDSYNQTLSSIVETAAEKPNLVYLYCKQGKSKFTRLYPLDKLVESNKNLTEIDPKITQNIQDYIIPEGGIQEICGKVVLMEKA